MLRDSRFGLSTANSRFWYDRCCAAVRSAVDAFDIEVKGGNLLPPVGPIGLALHAARDSHQTLSADARKVADRILKRLNRDRKARA